MILRLVGTAIVLVAGFLLTTKAIPAIWVWCGRRLGFRMRMTPITARRIQRFKRIRRGYYSFLAVCTLFVLSLFLELLVNTKPLAIYYDGRLAFPAVRAWLDKVIFFADINSFEAREDFGGLGKSEVDYDEFRRRCADPGLLDPQLEQARTSFERVQASFEKLEPPGPDATERQVKMYDFTKRQLEDRKASLAEAERAKSLFAGNGAWILTTLYPHSPEALRFDVGGTPPNAPSATKGIPLGTDVSGRDVLPLLFYGFRISLAFALLVAGVGYAMGVLVGGVQGYYGGWIDILSQRFVEIWGSIPFLFLIMIIGSLVTPTFFLLAVLMILLRSWLGITFYVRGEFYREKAKDYVQAAIGAGVSDWKIITKHILPNSLVPVVSFAPFGIVAFIGSLVSLDYLGFGLPPGTPSWGELLRQGLENVRFYPHLVYIPVIALASTLYAVVMIGEAVREAFDPKVFSRLR